MASPPRRSDYNPGGRPFTGRAMLLTILSFFGVIFAVNALMATLAVRNFRGVVVDSGYVASQDFNADRARIAAQAARGWRVAADAPQGRPRIALVGPNGAPLAGLRVAATALRPLDRDGDVTLRLRETAPGVWTAEQTLAPGQWRVALTADGSGPRHASSHLIVVAR